MMSFFSVVLFIILIGFSLACIVGGIALVIMGINTIKYSLDWDDVVFGILFIICAFLLFIVSLSILASFFILL